MENVIEITDEFVEIKRGNSTVLRFKGEQVGQASNQWIAGKDQTRWSDITIYSLADGRYLLYEEDFTRWQGEEGDDGYLVFDDAAALREYAIAKGRDLLFEAMDDAGLTVIIPL